MGLTEPLLLAVGIAGVIFMIYVFKLKARARMLAISAIVLVTILLSNRLLDSNLRAPSSVNSLWNLLPRQNPETFDLTAQTGWQNLPLDVLGILLAALSSQPAPVSPTPVPIPVSPAPVRPTPAPNLIIPALPPASPPISPVLPQPSPQPSFQAPQPSLQPSPVQPYRPYIEPVPTPIRPAPAQPAPAQPPISAWW